MNGVTENIVLHDLDLQYGGNKIYLFFISGTEMDSIKICFGDICRYWHFPTNGIITKIILRDLDLLFGSQNSRMLISPELGSRAKMNETTFKELNIW